MDFGYVIGVAAAAGGGKTTLIEALDARLEASRVIRFDDYPVTTPEDLEAWLATGADFDAWETPELAADLRVLKEGEAFLKDRRILFEAPLGRAHRATGGLIDLLVFIDTPLEVALSRWIRHRLDAAGDDPEEALGMVAGYLADYEPLLRGIYLAQRDRVMPGADLVLDGLDSPDTWVEAVAGLVPGID